MDKPTETFGSPRLRVWLSAAHGGVKPKVDRFDFISSSRCVVVAARVFRFTWKQG
jgi:hypothetical protein